jgi:hypothetical protein
MVSSNKKPKSPPGEAGLSLGRNEPSRKAKGGWQARRRAFVLDQSCRLDDPNDAKGERLAGYKEDGEINPHLRSSVRDGLRGGWGILVNEALRLLLKWGTTA